MTKKVLLSVLMSVGIVVGGFGVAYALGTFNAIQQGFRQGGEGQAARITMTVEAGSGDANSQFLPDNSSCSQSSPCPGGALAFAITNTSDFPIRVSAISQAIVFCGTAGTCDVKSSNKNTDGTFPTAPNSGSCVNDMFLTPPTDFRGWPTIAPHSTLQVNGTDNNQLGAGMIHLFNGTPDGCQGALFTVGLNVTATEQTGGKSGSGFAP
jgi:hypothetical protein